jgi:CDP-alcohol phosphatidyltransferase
MPSQLVQALPGIESSYKAREVEGIVDLYLYRPVGFRLAQLFASLRMTPSQVTFIGACFGIVAGHFYFYWKLSLNIVGMVFHVIANLFDNADGQLARLTNQKSRMGRVIDSFADHLIFTSIYLHLALRYLLAGASPAIGLLALAAALSHAWQASAADYFRNTYLWFVKGRSRADADFSFALREDYHGLRWRAHPWKKFLLGLYVRSTQLQEFFSPNLSRLREANAGEFAAGVPTWFQARYQDLARPLLQWWGWSMTNTRMFFLFLFLFVGRPVWYLWLELTLFNLLVGLLVVRQEKISRSLLELVRARSVSAYIRA